MPGVVELVSNQFDSSILGCIPRLELFGGLGQRRIALGTAESAVNVATDPLGFVT